MSTELWITLLGILGGMALQALAIYGGFRYFAGRTNTRLDNLEKKVDKHNNFCERLPIVEEQIKVINHRIDDLERGA